MARIIIARPTGADQIEVDQSVFDEGYFPGFVYLRDAGGVPSTETNVLDSSVATLVPSSSGSATAAALRAAYGRAAPALSAFSYDATTGNLLSYQEDGITITLTYNADGTVATSKRGTDATQTYSYTSGNLTGVA